MVMWKTLNYCEFKNCNEYKIRFQNGDIYVFNWPDLYAKNLLSKPQLYFNKNCFIKDLRNNLECEIKFIH